MEEFEIEFKELDQFEIEDVREVVVQEVPTFPALENLSITPNTEEQVFNHPNSYGYDEVRVEAVQGKSLEVTPSNEEQSFSDLYTNVKVLGDEDLQSSNIKQGVEIFGVTGSLEELTTETKEGIDNQEEIITNQESTLEEINQVIQDKILVKEKYKPRYISFYHYSGTELNEELANLDTSNITNMSYMFNELSKTTSLNLSGFNTSNVTNMLYLFGNSRKLTSLNISGWNTSNVTNMNQMFYSCEGFTSLDVSSLDTSKVTNMNYMFSYCTNLIELDLSNFNTSNVTSMYSMFYGCTKLTRLDIRNFDFTKVTSYTTMFGSSSSIVPNNCLIIVKGETEKQWITSKFSNLTNVKTVAELEG